jgi:hypothetical protein
MNAAQATSPENPIAVDPVSGNILWATSQKASGRPGHLTVTRQSDSSITPLKRLTPAITVTAKSNLPKGQPLRSPQPLPRPKRARREWRHLRAGRNNLMFRLPNGGQRTIRPAAKRCNERSGVTILSDPPSFSFRLGQIQRPSRQR